MFQRVRAVSCPKPHGGFTARRRISPLWSHLASFVSGSEPSSNPATACTAGAGSESVENGQFALKQLESRAVIWCLVASFHQLSISKIGQSFRVQYRFQPFYRLSLGWREPPQVRRAEKDDKARVNSENGETLRCVVVCFSTAVSESCRQNIHEHSDWSFVNFCIMIWFVSKTIKTIMIVSQDVTSPIVTANEQLHLAVAWHLHPQASEKNKLLEDSNHRLWEIMIQVCFCCLHVPQEWENFWFGDYWNQQIPVEISATTILGLVALIYGMEYALVPWSSYTSWPTKTPSHHRKRKRWNSPYSVQHSSTDFWIPEFAAECKNKGTFCTGQIDSKYRSGLRVAFS